ncbi:MAG: helix-turn-helix transcriptional regulator [Ruminococcaceae bacterium]|nr:helix-turn-helix transcriptional regulator [Oscillospiraceae bacterium]
MINVDKNMIYIKNLISVFKSQIKKDVKLRNVDGRFSDAFIYIISGSCKYEFADKSEFTVNGGDILYLAKDAKYKMNVLSDIYKYVCCNFDFDLNETCQSNVYTPKNSSSVENLFYRLLKLYISSLPSSNAECLSILYSIYSDVISTSQSTYIDKEAKNKVLSAKEFIDACLKDVSLSVSIVSDNLNISEVYFRKLFKSQYGISPSQYIINKRIENAKHLMKHQYLTLEECALQSGFSSLQYFCRIFKKLTGITPSQYRKNK